MNRGRVRLDGRARVSLHLALTLLLVLPHPLWAATIIVDNTNCTLADAITAANTDSPAAGCPAGSGADTIELTADVTLTVGLPNVDSVITIDGNGFTVEHPTGAGLVAVESYEVVDTHLTLDRITLRKMWVLASVAQLTITNSTVSDSNSTGIRFHYSSYAGDSTLSNVTVSGHGGSGILIGDQSRVFLNGCDVKDNAGLGIDITSARGGSVATLDHSHVTGNSDSGIKISHTDFGSINGALLTNSTVSGNGRYGIHIRDAERPSYAFLTNSTVSNNLEDGINFQGPYGGAYWNPVPVQLTNSSVSGNGGNGIRMSAPVFGASAVQLTNSTVSDNDGDGLYLWAGSSYSAAISARLTNSTVSGNNGDGVYLRKGGDDHYGLSFVQTASSTISGNFGTGISSCFFDSGGCSPLPFEMQNTIVANTDGGPDCLDVDIDDLGGNFDDDQSCGPGFGTITGLDPGLAHNGGPTLTHALLPGSSAINAAGECALPTDQRGYPRDDGSCDSGSFEVQQCMIDLVEGEAGTLIYYSPETSTFDLVTGLLSTLLANHGYAGSTCLGSDETSPAEDLMQPPPAGDGRFYLARGLDVGCVGEGYGSSSLTPDPRDLLDSGPCP